jgi:nicotinate phosphoribosyltransferase
MGVSADAPSMDMAYKLVEYAGKPRLKLSPGKATWPGPKQVWRRSEGGRFIEDIIALAGEPGSAGARPLLQPVMVDGKVVQRESLAAARERARAGRLSLPDGVRRLRAPDPYPVRISEPLQALRASLTGGGA